MDEAIQFVCAKNIHQCMWLPATSDHDKLRVTFSTTSNFSDSSLPAVLFCVPMFATRYVSLDLDKFAKDMSVRIVSVDRPGMGGSSPVPLNIRVMVWLETVPALLAKLNLKHINLLSHSAGTIYSLNTVYHLPEILDPDRPFTAMLGPWVDHLHSKTSLMSLASRVPNSWFSSWNKVQSAIGTTVAPTVSWSGGVVSSVAELFNPRDLGTESGDTTDAERYGVSDEVAKEINKLRWKFLQAEDTTAGNEEARLCLKKLGPGNWDACEDYAEYVRDLVSRRQSEPKLNVRVIYAESDMMIGKGGQEYFDKCWNQDGVQEAVTFKSEELPGTNHDSCVLDLKKGGLRKIFEEIAQRS